MTGFGKTGSGGGSTVTSLVDTVEAMDSESESVLSGGSVSTKSSVYGHPRPDWLSCRCSEVSCHVYLGDLVLLLGLRLGLLVVAAIPLALVAVAVGSCAPSPNFWPEAVWPAVDRTACCLTCWLV